MTVPFDPRISVFSDRAMRSTQLMRSLGMDGLGLSLAMAFHDATRPWTARALADYIHHPRTNVLKRLREMEAAGIVAKTEEGWAICPQAQAMYCRMLAEFLDLLSGERIGFSPEVVAFYERASSGIGRPSRRHMDADLALSISFPRQDPIFAARVGKAAR